MSFVEKYTPHMSAYSGEFADSGEINWLPYLMYFHPINYKSPTVNTDSAGFRYAEARNIKYSVADLGNIESVRIIAGSSTVFGIGASGDQHTLASRLTENDSRDEYWLNFGGRSFNSTQEMILFTLNSHRLPKVKEIVLFSGFNDLGLARLPDKMRMDHGAFFMCRDFFDAMEKKKHSAFSAWFSKDDEPEDIPDLEEQMNYASMLTLRHLAVWKAMAESMGAKLTFVLQPLSNWVRDVGSKEEQDIFSELEERGNFTETYGDILTEYSFQQYSSKLEQGAANMGVDFINMSPIIAAAINDDQWLFVDRIHFNDAGHDFLSKLLLDKLSN
jgi:hypothetical protein